jgi:hypothetical protein
MPCKSACSMWSRKSQGAVRSLGGSNPSPSADNPNRLQRCGIKQERGGPRARLFHRLKPLGTAMECRATVAQRRRDPSNAEECVRLATSGAPVVEANGRPRSFWRQRACAADCLDRQSWRGSGWSRHVGGPGATRPAQAQRRRQAARTSASAPRRWSRRCCSRGCGAWPGPNGRPSSEILEARETV